MTFLDPLSEACASDLCEECADPECGCGCHRIGDEEEATS